MTGTIWSEGVHQVFVDKKPARVKVTQATIPDSYKAFQHLIDENGGIQIGIDHIPDELVSQYPILEKLDPLNVGMIKEVQTDGNRVYATKTEHTNPLIAELYSNGELTDFSVVASISADVNEGDDADYVFNNFKTIKRMDYVDEGGCQACKVGMVPDGMVLTARLSIKEEDNLTDENTQNETETTEENTTNENMENTSEETQTEETTETTEEPKFVTQEQLDEKFNEIKNLITENQTTEAPIEARLAEVEKDNNELKLEAKKAKIEPIIDNAIKQGKILPVDREMFLQAGLSAEDVDKWKKGLDKRETVVDLDEKSKHLKAGNSGEKLSMEDMRTARQAGKF